MGKRKSAALKAQRTAAAGRWVLPSLAAALLGLSLAALAVGTYPLSPGDALSLLFGGGTAGSREETVLFAIRLPRVAAAITVGAALAAAGTAYQGMFRNPLVSPDILGVSSGAGLGAVAGFGAAGLGVAAALGSGAGAGLGSGTAAAFGSSGLGMATGGGGGSGSASDVWATGAGGGSGGGFG